MFTSNLINNARFIGHRMSFTSADVLCCPPPLFHCFGLVLGLLTCLSHGASIIIPSPTFSAPAVLSVLSTENVTALHGVPAMFEELLSLPRPASFSCPNLRTGIIAGAPVPKPLMERLFKELNMTEYTSSYGLTEASPTCFNATTTTSIERRLNSVGKVMPHMHSKIVGRDGQIVPVGQRGELCMAGYSLQKGYWQNEEKTNECMVRDESGVLWLHTGDEAVFDPDGYCTITGRFKDIIIRGWYCIYLRRVTILDSLANSSRTQEAKTSTPSKSSPASSPIPQDTSLAPQSLVFHIPNTARSWWHSSSHQISRTGLIGPQTRNCVAGSGKRSAGIKHLCMYFGLGMRRWVWMKCHRLVVAR